MPLQYKTVELAIAQKQIVTQLTLAIPQAADHTAPMLMDTLLVVNIDGDPAPELILPAFAGPYASLVKFDAPVWIMDVNATSFSNLQTLSYQSARRALTLDVPGSTSKALVFPAFTDVWPQTAPGTLFLPTATGYQKVVLNQLQTHGPSSGVLTPGGPSYVLIPSQWADSANSANGVYEAGGLWMARLNSAGTGLTYTALGQINGQDLGSSGSSVIPATAKSGAFIYLGQSYVDGNNRSDIIIPMKTQPDGTPQIDSSRPLQIFNDFWNLPENRALAQTYPQVVAFDKANPQNLNDYSHVVTAETADLNGDGLPDVLSAHAYRGPDMHLMMLVPYIQQADGSFQQEAASTFTDFDVNKDVPYRLFVQDLNHDGHVDIAFSSEMWDDTRYPGSTSSGVYLNDGLGHFVRGASDENLLALLDRSQIAVVDSDSGPQIVRIQPGWNGAQPVFNVQLLGTQANYSGPYGSNPALQGAPGFNEWFYLHQNPDVAALVNSGTYATGLDHYLQLGRQQGRAAFAPGTTVWGTPGLDTVNEAESTTAVYWQDGALRVPHGAGVDILHNIERIRFQDQALAFDLSGAAGEVAKILGAVFGPSAVANKEYAGIGLYYKDVLGYSYNDLMQLAINARLGPNPSSAQVVDLLYTNVVGQAPDADTRKSFTDLLDHHTYTVASLGVMAADTGLNASNIQLTGLVNTGLAYLPLAG